MLESGQSSCLNIVSIIIQLVTCILILFHCITVLYRVIVYHINKNNNNMADNASLMINLQMETEQSSTFARWLEAVHQNNSLNTTGETDNIRIEDFELASKPHQYFLIALYSITAALALGGNVMSIIVLTQGKRSSNDLRLFLVSLSASDITMSIFSIPFTYTSFILGRWIFPLCFCPLVHAMQVLSVFVSIYTLTLIGIDR